MGCVGDVSVTVERVVTCACRVWGLLSFGGLGAVVHVLLFGQVSGFKALLEGGCVGCGGTSAARGPGYFGGMIGGPY